MKTEKLTGMRPVEYWSCTHSDHWHKSKEVAEECIAKSEAPKQVIRWTPDALTELLKKVRNGMTQKELASEYELTTSRMHQVIAKAQRLEIRSMFKATPTKE